ncbi:ketosynthase chain-length factor [Streptomyces iconiensis]|uniref:Ketosynthase chain-length factor n=2 Tax=Streptomyces iconiensis TaxID=1384038 RepID=A0ABT7A6C9_9ACTN|nr:ketosynthase chain-length factor [Streptomyces iconiensis]MDJ1136885.1 ketosynthase chain-length factor [Streptomyces iconiensis]
MGIVAPNGLGLEAYWSATLRGRGGIDDVSLFDAAGYPATLAGEVSGFDAAVHLPGRLLAQTDRMTRLALVAAEQALADAGLGPEEAAGDDSGVVTASASGGFEFGQRELQKLWSKGSRHVSAYQSFAWFYAVNTGQISIRHGLRGPSGGVVTEQAGGIDAIASARRHLRKGARLMVTGGVDSALCPWGWVAQLASGRVSSARDPRGAYLPFDASARGHVPGEGGAILVLEDGDCAPRSRPYGRIMGYAATFDPPHGEPQLGRAARCALDDAGLLPGDVDVVFADAAGTAELDRAEAAAIAEVFGAYSVPVTAPKTMTGRLSSGGAALDVATALLALRDQVIPPTTNVTRPAPGLALDLVLDEPREAPLRRALVLSRGHGGFNAAMALGPAPR